MRKLFIIGAILLTVLASLAVIQAATWHSNTPTISNYIATDIPNMKENLDYLKENLDDLYQRDNNTIYLHQDYSDNLTQAIRVDCSGTCTHKRIVVESDVAISDNATVPSGMTLEILPGSVMRSVYSGKHLTISGPLVAPNDRQIFDDNTTGHDWVKFSKTVEVQGKWWGSTNDGVASDTNAVLAAYNSLPLTTNSWDRDAAGKIYLPGIWRFNLTVAGKNGVEIYGDAPYADYAPVSTTFASRNKWVPDNATIPVIELAPQDNSGAWLYSTTHGFVLHDAIIVPDGVVPAAKGLFLHGFTEAHLYNFHVSGFTGYQIKVTDANDLVWSTMLSMDHCSIAMTQTGHGILHEKSGTVTTATGMYMDHCTLWGYDTVEPDNGTYALKGCENWTFSNGWIECGSNTGGKHCISFAPDILGSFNLVNAVVEEWPWTETSIYDPYYTQAPDVRVQMVNSSITGMYENSLGQQFSFGPDNTGGGGASLLAIYPQLYQPWVRHSMRLVGLGDNQTVGDYNRIDKVAEGSGGQILLTARRGLQMNTNTIHYETVALTDNETDGYAAQFILYPLYSSTVPGMVVDRHNYFAFYEPYTDANSTVTEAAIFRWQNGLASNKSTVTAESVGTQTGAYKVNMGGTTMYVPVYSKSAAKAYTHEKVFDVPTECYDNPADNTTATEYYFDAATVYDVGIRYTRYRNTVQFGAENQVKNCVLSWEVPSDLTSTSIGFRVRGMPTAEDMNSTAYVTWGLSACVVDDNATTCPSPSSTTSTYAPSSYYGGSGFPVPGSNGTLKQYAEYSTEWSGTPVAVTGLAYGRTVYLRLYRGEVDPEWGAKQHGAIRLVVGYN